MAQQGVLYLGFVCAMKALKGICSYWAFKCHVYISLRKTKKKGCEAFFTCDQWNSRRNRSQSEKIAFLALNACFYLGSNKIEILKYYPGLCTQFDKWIENDKTCEMFVWEKRGI